MPANPKYLSSKGQRVLKVSAAILGGYILATMAHLLLGVIVPNKGVVIITAAYSTFFFWILFMILAFLFKSGWKAWGVYLLASLLLAVIIYVVR
ncbi:hypothetical protein DF185_17230 [Marinifilum breve]|uniref:Uncharacterized protein n=1 Tax=Marinifilum breve TaxID=2184082 RepID=A0A2V3ZUH9_9BACT|nr:hypothetical protein [Marinifilum breve]PXX98071.1 hypothetical protein DF185_17230 [Marinifilum breve]